MGLQGARPGKVLGTNVPDKASPGPLDRVNRVFKAVHGLCHRCLVRRLVGWRVSRTMQTDFVRDALEQALYERRADADALLHHSDSGSPYLSIRYTERVAKARIQPSVGSRCDSYDNALAESINGLDKAELIHRRCPWTTKEAMEMASLQWVHWFDQTLLLTPIGGVPLPEAEARYWR